MLSTLSNFLCRVRLTDLRNMMLSSTNVQPVLPGQVGGERQSADIALRFHHSSSVYGGLLPDRPCFDHVFSNGLLICGNRFSFIRFVSKCQHLASDASNTLQISPIRLPGSREYSLFLAKRHGSSPGRRGNGYADPPRAANVVVINRGSPTNKFSHRAFHSAFYNPSFPASHARRTLFRALPHRYPPIAPVLRMTRWQGIR